MKKITVGQIDEKVIERCDEYVNSLKTGFLLCSKSEEILDFILTNQKKIFEFLKRIKEKLERLEKLHKKEIKKYKEKENYKKMIYYG